MMDNRKQETNKPSDTTRGLVLLESMSRYIDARLSVLLPRSKDAASVANGTAGSIRFSRRITSRKNCALITNTYEFLCSLLGTDFGAAEMRGFSGSMIYKELGRRFQQFIHYSSLESPLSLTINRLLQCFGIWLNQPYTAQMVSRVEAISHFS